MADEGPRAQASGMAPSPPLGTNSAWVSLLGEGMPGPPGPPGSLLADSGNVMGVKSQHVLPGPGQCSSCPPHHTPPHWTSASLVPCTASGLILAQAWFLPLGGLAVEVGLACS